MPNYFASTNDSFGKQPPTSGGTSQPGQSASGSQGQSQAWGSGQNQSNARYSPAGGQGQWPPQGQQGYPPQGGPQWNPQGGPQQWGRPHGGYSPQSQQGVGDASGFGGAVPSAQQMQQFQSQFNPQQQAAMNLGAGNYQPLSQLQSQQLGNNMAQQMGLQGQPGPAQGQNPLLQSMGQQQQAQQGPNNYFSSARAQQLPQQPQAGSTSPTGAVVPAFPGFGQ